MLLRRRMTFIVSENETLIDSPLQKWKNEQIQHQIQKNGIASKGEREFLSLPRRPKRKLKNRKYKHKNQNPSALSFLS